MIIMYTLGTPKDEKVKVAGRKSSMGFSLGILVSSTDYKSFQKTCDIDHAEVMSYIDLTMIVYNHLINIGLSSRQSTSGRY